MHFEARSNRILCAAIYLGLHGSKLYILGHKDNVVDHVTRMRPISWKGRIPVDDICIGLYECGFLYQATVTYNLHGFHVVLVIIFI